MTRSSVEIDKKIKQNSDQEGEPYSGSKWGWLWGPISIAGIIIAFISLLFQSTQPVLAEDKDMNRFSNAYPSILGTRLDTCDICHVKGSDRLNSYGGDYKNNGRNVTAIENLDSDGDGHTNLTEIMALTFPGNSADFPVPTPEPTSTPSPIPDVSVSKQAMVDLPSPGQPVTFTLAVENLGTGTATGVVVSDLLSNNIQNPTWGNSISLNGITARSGLEYVWDLPDLTPGASGIITIYGRLNPGLPTDFTLINIATISTADTESNTNNNQSTAIIGGERVYLPAITKIPEGN